MDLGGPWTELKGLQETREGLGGIQKLLRRSRKYLGERRKKKNDIAINLVADHRTLTPSPKSARLAFK